MHHHSCGYCQAFAKYTSRMSKQELKYAREEDLGKFDFGLTEFEAQLQKMYRLEHNTVDLINENLKLKELLKYAGSHLTADLVDARKRISQLEAELKLSGERFAQSQRDLDNRNATISELQLNSAKRRKEYDDLLRTLAEREKAIDDASSYADSILEDKKKLMA